MLFVIEGVMGEAFDVKGFEGWIWEGFGYCLDGFSSRYVCVFSRELSWDG
jgi:hypothetical protein